MAEQVNLWVAGEDGMVEPLPRRPHVEYEHHFEEMLIQRPEMLGEGVTLVGRQLMTESGPLDLLGIDEEGKLVVYELKRGEAPRHAITQAIDYASWLDSLSYDELARRITDHRPGGFEREFDDFDDWYSDRFDEDQVAELRPARIAVVGLGLEPAAERMAHWLADKGVDVEVVTFHAFKEGDRTLFARQVEVSTDDVRRPLTSSSQRNDPVLRAAEFQAAEVYQSAFQLLARCFAEAPYKVHKFKNGVNFALPTTEDRRSNRHHGYVGPFVRTDATGHVNIFVRRAAVDACPDELSTLLESVKPLAIRTELRRSGNEAFITVDADSLEQVAPHLSKFAEAAIAAWQHEWDEWNADSSAHDPATTLSEGNES